MRAHTCGANLHSTWHPSEGVRSPTTARAQEQRRRACPPATSAAHAPVRHAVAMTAVLSVCDLRCTAGVAGCIPRAHAAEPPSSARLLAFHVRLRLVRRRRRRRRRRLRRRRLSSLCRRRRLCPSPASSVAAVASASARPSVATASNRRHHRHHDAPPPLPAAATSRRATSHCGSSGRLLMRLLCAHHSHVWGKPRED